MHKPVHPTPISPMKRIAKLAKAIQTFTFLVRKYPECYPYRKTLDDITALRNQLASEIGRNKTDQRRNNDTSRISRSGRTRSGRGAKR